MSSASLVDLVESLRSARVLCVGDVMLDRYLYGEVSRISPEGPVPVLQVNDEQHAPGGVGNVAHNLATLGVQCSVVSVTGDDAHADELGTSLAVDAELDAVLLRDPERRTTVKTRCVGGRQQMLRLDHERVEPLSTATRERLLGEVQKRLSVCDLLLLSDYAKGALDSSTLAALLCLAHEASVSVVIDPKRPPFDRYRGASVLTPNLKELASATGLAVISDDEVVAAASLLIEKCELHGVLVTRSEKGMSWVGVDEVAHVPTYQQQVFDVSGAGDTAVAVFAAARSIRADWPSATRLANAAAGVAVSKFGTAAVSPLELIAATQTHDVYGTRSKILSLDELSARVESWRRQGQRVGFTNGCFDLLHPGHVSLLANARARCDKLVVGLNSDESVRRLKGDHRPIQSEDARAQILVSMTDVDVLSVFATDTPLELIEQLRPDVIFKGSDYLLDEVVGADVVMRYGGRVELIDLIDGQSTTSLIKRSKVD